jgi:hypothetical protein
MNQFIPDGLTEKLLEAQAVNVMAATIFFAVVGTIIVVFLFMRFIAAQQKAFNHTIDNNTKQLELNRASNDRMAEGWEKVISDNTRQIERLIAVNENQVTEMKVIGRNQDAYNVLVDDNLQRVSENILSLKAEMNNLAQVFNQHVSLSASERGGLKQQFEEANGRHQQCHKEIMDLLREVLDLARKCNETAH